MKKMISLAMLLIANFASAETPDKTLMIKLGVSDSQYVLQDSWLLPQVFPAAADAGVHNGLRWTLRDQNQLVIAEGWIDDPQKVNGAFVPQGGVGNADYHHVGGHRVASTVVIIRTPYDERMKTLLIERQTPIDVNASKLSSGAQPAPVAKSAEFLLKPRGLGEGQ